MRHIKTPLCDSTWNVSISSLRSVNLSVGIAFVSNLVVVLSYSHDSAAIPDSQGVFDTLIYMTILPSLRYAHIYDYIAKFAIHSYI